MITYRDIANVTGGNNATEYQVNFSASDIANDCCDARADIRTLADLLFIQTDRAR